MMVNMVQPAGYGALNSLTKQHRQFVWSFLAQGDPVSRSIDLGQRNVL